MRLRPFLSLTLAVGLIPTPSFAAPQIQHWTTSSGTAVYFTEAPQIPMLDIQLVVDAGNSRDGDLPGLSRITHALLETGAGNMDADTIAQRLEDVGASYSTEIKLDRSEISLRTLTEEDWKVQALDTYITILGAPAFTSDQIELRRQQMLVSLKKLDEDPGAIASQLFYANLYPGHPYGSPAAGTEDSVNAIDRDDIVGFYEEFFAAKGAVIAMIGAIDRTQAEAIAERISVALPQGDAPTALPAPEPVLEAKTIRVEHPSKQAHIRIGQQGVARGQKQHFPVYLGNFTLGGGGFSSRLLQEIRTRQGLAYSVYSYFFPMRHRGPFQLGLQTRGDQAEQALSSAYAEVERFVASGPTAEELTHSRNNLVLGFPLRIADNASMINYLAMIGYYGLPLDYLDTWTKRVEAITHEQIVAAFQDTLNPEHLITVVVGGQGQP